MIGNLSLLQVFSLRKCADELYAYEYEINLIDWTSERTVWFFDKYTNTRW